MPSSFHYIRHLPWGAPPRGSLQLYQRIISLNVRVEDALEIIQPNFSLMENRSEEGNEQFGVSARHPLSKAGGLGRVGCDHRPSRQRGITSQKLRGVGSGRMREREEGLGLGEVEGAACGVATANLSRPSPQVSEDVDGGWEDLGTAGGRLRWGLRGGRGPARPTLPPGPASGRPSPPGCPPRPGASPAPAGAGARAAASTPQPGLSRRETRVS